MITLTSTAAKQMAKSFGPNDKDTVLRVAVQQKPDGDFHYLMGLDDPKAEDIRFLSHDIKIAISEKHSDLLNNLEIDYLEIEAGKFEFIFKNPNDPKYKKPTE